MIKPSTIVSRWAVTAMVVSGIAFSGSAIAQRNAERSIEGSAYESSVYRESLISLYMRQKQVELDQWFQRELVPQVAGNIALQLSDVSEREASPYFAERLVTAAVVEVLKTRSDFGGALECVESALRRTTSPEDATALMAQVDLELFKRFSGESGGDEPSQFGTFYALIDNLMSLCVPK